MRKALFILFTFALEMAIVRLELRELKDGCLEQQYCCSAEQFPVLLELRDEQQVRVEDPVCFKLRLQKTGQIVEVDGQMQTRVGLVCGRCLQPFETDIQSDFALTFTPKVVQQEPTAAEDVELDADELGLIYYTDETLELLQPLQEQIIMALPISPVCDPDCLGLCPECGCDLNKEHCACVKQPFNNKFVALAAFKNKKNHTES
jgi:DUF177 domain-containing protein